MNTNEFNKRREKFNREFEKSKRQLSVLFWASTIAGLSLVGFIIWVIIKLMQFFGII